MRKKPDQVAYAEAINDLAALLRRHGVPDHYDVAHEWIRSLVAAGWRHTRPARDLEPPKGTPALPDAVPEYVAAREALRDGGGS